METPNQDLNAVAQDVAAEHSRRLDKLIREEAGRCGGLLPFHRFMDLALYAPGLGYYVAGAHKFGPQGDFVTAPEVSSLFAHCIAEQCREVFAVLGGGDILEFGAGSGALAADLLASLAATTNLPRRYLILELSPDLRRQQQRRLAAQVPDLLSRVRWLDRLPTEFQGCVLANEVLDAMPVHRFRVGLEGAALELFVEPSPGGWTEVAAAPVSCELETSLHALQGRGLATHPGYESEINLRLAPWILALAETMARGLVLIIDYGYSQSEYYRTDRRGGTLMCHYRHHAHTDPYVHLGLQDITAHVDFSALAQAGRRSGLRVAGYTSQANFLIGCGLDRLLAEVSTGANALDEIAGAKQLILPSAMGERFQVLGLDKGIDGSWMGFSFRDLRDRLE